MKAKNILVAAVSMAALAGGVTIEFRNPDQPSGDDVSYLKALLDPVELARQQCNSTADSGSVGKRAAFLRLARLHAAELPVGASPAGAPPLWRDLGTLELDISTDNAAAQDYFNQGMRDRKTHV